MVKWACQAAGIRAHGGDQHDGARSVGLVSREGEHDEIGIEAMKGMPGVGIVLGHRPLEPNILHNFVFTLSVMPMKNKCQELLPRRNVSVESWPPQVRRRRTESL